MDVVSEVKDLPDLKWLEASLSVCVCVCVCYYDMFNAHVQKN